MDTLSSLRTVFSWDFLTTLSAAATAVIAITNTLSRVWRLSRSWAGFIAAEVLTFYALCAPPGAPNPWAYLGAFMLGFILFGYALGINQSVVGISQRTLQPARSAQGGWWDSWV